VESNWGGRKSKTQPHLNHQRKSVLGISQWRVTGEGGKVKHINAGFIFTKASPETSGIAMQASFCTCQKPRIFSFWLLRSLTVAF
jgi:hypothetical protein